MMMVDVSQEIHEIRDQVHLIDRNVTKLTTLVEGLIDETKDQKEKISLLQKFKNKILGAFITSHTIILIGIPILIALL